MTAVLEQFNKAFESKTRLEIMSILMVNEAVSFNTFKELLNMTDGNLATHTRSLEQQGFVTVQKQFIGRKPNTTYSASQEGKQAFLAHLDALEVFIKERP